MLLKKHDTRWSRQSSLSNPTNEIKEQTMNNMIKESNALIGVTEQQNNEGKVFSQEEISEIKTSQQNLKHNFKSITLKRTHCNVKDEKSGLNFSTLFVAKFIRRIKEVSSLMRFKEMGLAQFELIRDSASDYNYFFMKGAFAGESPGVLDKIQQAIQNSYLFSTFIGSCKSQNKLDTTCFIILPNSHFRMIWNALLFVILITNVIYIPLKYSFDLESDLGRYNWFFNIFPQFFFLAEIFLNFQTAIYRKGLIITKKSLIFQSYIKGRFFLDIVFIILYFMGVHTDLFSDLAVVFRTYDLFLILGEISERMQFRGKAAGMFELFKLIFFLALFAHFIACSWYKVGELSASSGEEVTWLNSLQKDTVPDSFYAYYITSLYWAVVTMITLGYGDIVPKNWKERLFVIFITQLSCIIFAYSTNSIGEILREMARKGLVFKNQMGLIDTYMRKRGLHQLTQMKVRKYFEYLNKESLEDSEKSNDLISGLPQTLKEEVYSDAYGRVLKQKKIFSLNFSQPFLKELSLLMRERRLGPEEELFKVNEISDSIYIVMKGKVQVFLGNGRMLKILVKGDLIGEIGFFSDRMTDYKAVTLNVASLAVLKKEDFLAVIRGFPADFEKYSLMKDNINLYENIKGLGHKCMGCGSYTHYLPACQFVNYSKNSHKVLNLYTKNYPQKRVFYERKHLFKFKTLQNLKQVYDCVLKQIFVSSKFAKAQDLQEELSDMNSDSSNINDADVMSPNLDSVEGDEVEASKAAISMISNLSPQFTKEFLSRTKIQNNNSFAEEKPQKASRFANLQKKVNSSSEEDEQELEIESNESKQEQNQKGQEELQSMYGNQLKNARNSEQIIQEESSEHDNLMKHTTTEENGFSKQIHQQDTAIQPKRVTIAPSKNSYKTDNNEDHLQFEEHRKLKSSSKVKISSGDHLLAFDYQIGSPSNNVENQNDLDDSSLSNAGQTKQKSFAILPKQAFLNLKRPRDQRAPPMKLLTKPKEQNLEDCSSSENSLLVNPNNSLSHRSPFARADISFNACGVDFSLSQAKRKRYNQWAKVSREKKQKSSENIIRNQNIASAKVSSTASLQLDLSENQPPAVAEYIQDTISENIPLQNDQQSLKNSNKKEEIQPQEESYSTTLKTPEYSQRIKQQEFKIGGWLSPIPRVFEQGGFSPFIANIVQAQDKTDKSPLTVGFTAQAANGISSPQQHSPRTAASSTNGIPLEEKQQILRKLPHSHSLGNRNHNIALFRQLKSKEYRNFNSIHEEQETSRNSASNKDQNQSNHQLVLSKKQSSNKENNSNGTTPVLIPHKIRKYTSSQTSIKLPSVNQFFQPSSNELNHYEIEKGNQINDGFLVPSKSNIGSKNIELIMGEQCLFAYNFDKLKEYEIYFPEFNFSNIIAKSNNIRKKNLGYRMMATKKRIEVRRRLAIFSKLKI